MQKANGRKKLHNLYFCKNYAIVASATTYSTLSSSSFCLLS